MRESRRRLKLTLESAALTAEINCGYLSLIERTGFLPRREVVLRLSRALRVPASEALLRAGYAPASLTPERFEELLQIEPLPLPADALRELRRMEPGEQRAISDLLRAMVARVRAEATR